MKKFLAVGAAAAFALSLAACNTPGDRAAGGALLGGATGAAIGAAATGRPGGALAGAAIGAAGGAIVGAATTPQPRGCAEWGYDPYGNPVCIASY
jgi:osmotically inducible lipoprotein OsmB